MYVCVCRAVSERQIREQVAQGARSLRDLQQNCGLGSCCGKCVPLARECLKQAQEELCTQVAGGKVTHLAQHRQSAV